MTEYNQKVAFIGAGNMAGAIIKGLLGNGMPASKIIAAAPSDTHLKDLRDHFGVVTTHDNIEAVESADIVVLGVKPQIMQTTCEALASKISDSSLVMSLAAGITCEKLAKWLAFDGAIVRCMPNTPSRVKQGASGLYATETVTEQQKESAETLMTAVGICQWVENESLIDSVTAVSGSGPAYFFLFMEAMVEAACAQGLEKSVATKLAIQTALGAATLAQHSEQDLATLRQDVSSPNGTTERAIQSFENNNLRALVREAMDACATRAKELAE